MVVGGIERSRGGRVSEMRLERVVALLVRVATGVALARALSSMT